MKIKIVKKMLSILLIASGLATTPFAVSAANDGKLGDSMPAAGAKNSQNELENDIKELDETISQLKDMIEFYKNDRDSKIEEIDDQIKLYSKKLNKIEKNLRYTGPRKKFKSLKTKNLLQITDRKLKRITKKLNSSRQRDDRLKKQFEVLKRKIEGLLKEKKSVESKFQENTKIEREQLKLCSINKNEKMERLLKERESVESEFQENTKIEREELENLSASKSQDVKRYLEVLREKAGNLYEQSDNLGAKFRSFSKPDKNKLSKDDRYNLLSLPLQFKKLCEKDELNQDDINEFNSFESTFKDLQTKIDAINSVKDSQSESLELDQAQEKLNLWKKINSGSQSYEPDYVESNLCWLHSATNVLNYYNYMDNQGIIKGQHQAVQKYTEIMGDQASLKNINGDMNDFEEITEYLKAMGYGILKLSISGSEKIAKELLKIHFQGNNPAPVIIHQPDHFITIANYDQNTDQFLIVDSYNLKQPNAAIEWSKKLPEDSVDGRTVISLLFTSKALNDNMSYMLDDDPSNSNFDTVQQLIKAAY